MTQIEEPEWNEEPISINRIQRDDEHRLVHQEMRAEAARQLKLKRQVERDKRAADRAKALAEAEASKDYAKATPFSEALKKAFKTLDTANGILATGASLSTASLNTANWKISPLTVAMASGQTIQISGYYNMESATLTYDVPSDTTVMGISPVLSAALEEE